jgi:hypothetical protein
MKLIKMLRPVVQASSASDLSASGAAARAGDAVTTGVGEAGAGEGVTGGAAVPEAPDVVGRGETGGVADAPRLAGGVWAAAGTTFVTVRNVRVRPQTATIEWQLRGALMACRSRSAPC